MYSLELLGWTGQDAEWIALVCLHSGVFTRAQFCHYFDTQRMTAARFVKTLIERREAVETDVIAFNGEGKTCRIIFQFIEGWYNPHRRHKGTGQKSPIEKLHHLQHDPSLELSTGPG